MWTKMDTAIALGSSKEDLNTNANMATAFIIRKCQKSVDIVNEWYKNVSCYHLLDDSKSIAENHPKFRENRHDQSILSLLLKKHKCVTLNDETYFYPNWETNGAKYPIWAIRNRNG